MPRFAEKKGERLPICRRILYENLVWQLNTCRQTVMSQRMVLSVNDVNVSIPFLPEPCHV